MYWVLSCDDGVQMSMTYSTYVGTTNISLPHGATCTADLHNAHLDNSELDITFLGMEVPVCRTCATWLCRETAFYKRSCTHRRIEFETEVLATDTCGTALDGICQDRQSARYVAATAGHVVCPVGTDASDCDDDVPTARARTPMVATENVLYAADDLVPIPMPFEQRHVRRTGWRLPRGVLRSHDPEGVLPDGIRGGRPDFSREGDIRARTSRCRVRCLHGHDGLRLKTQSSSSVRTGARRDCGPSVQRSAPLAPGSCGATETMSASSTEKTIASARWTR